MKLSKQHRLLIVVGIALGLIATGVGASLLPEHFFAKTTIGGVNQWSIRADVARTVPANAGAFVLQALQREADKEKWDRAFRECAFKQIDLVELASAPQRLEELSRVVNEVDARIECRTMTDWLHISSAWLLASFGPLILLFLCDQLIGWIRRGD